MRGRSGGKNPEQLIDLSADPGELRNLTADKKAHAILEERRATVRRWISSTSDGLRPAAG